MQKYIYLLLILFLQLSCGAAMKEKIVKSGKAEIYTESIGNIKDPAILLIMGATASSVWWDVEFCKMLADEGFFVIRYDNRDVGRSTTYTPGEKLPYSLDDMVDDAIAVLDSYQLDAANFVGMSLGGMISQIAAIKYPDRVASLTLISSGPFGPTDIEIPEMDKRILEYQAGRFKIDWNNEEEVVEFMLKGGELLNGSAYEYDREKGEKLAREEFRRARNLLSMFNHSQLQGGEEYYGRLAEIEQNTLIIHGTEDIILHYKNALALSEEIKNTTLLTLEGVGHEMPEQTWESIVNAIKEFVIN